MKPVLQNGGFSFSYIGRQAFLVLRRLPSGCIDSVGTCQHVAENACLEGAGPLFQGKPRSSGARAFFTITERRTVDDAGFLKIETKLFKSGAAGTLGKETELSQLARCAAVPPVQVLKRPVGNLGLIPLKTPVPNCVDGTHAGVSVFAAAAGKIRTQYALEKRTVDEFTLTEPHLVVSADIQRRDENGRLLEIPKYITPLLDADPAEAGLGVWNPKPNQQELEARANQNLRDIENIIGLRRGFLSKSEREELTATEIVSTSTKMAHLVAALQRMWEGAVCEAVRTCDVLGRLYLGWDNTPPPAPRTTWGNGVLYDEDKEFSRLERMVESGRLKEEYLLGWYFGMPTATAEDLAKIREKYMP